MFGSLRKKGRRWQYREKLGKPNMQNVLIASPPGVFYAGLLIGITVVAAILTAFLCGKRRFGWRRLLLCVLTLILGPLAGALLGGLTIMFNDAHPLDRWPTVISFTSVGAVAGVVAAMWIGITSLFQGLKRSCCRQREHNGTSKSPRVRAK